MTQQRKAGGLCGQVPCERRQRAVGRGGRRHSAHDLGAQQSIAGCADIGIQYHGVGVDTLAVAASQADTARAPALGQDLRDLGAVANRRAVALGDVRQRDRQLMHAALDQPDAFLLDVRDQHQCRRR